MGAKKMAAKFFQYLNLLNPETVMVNSNILQQMSSTCTTSMCLYHTVDWTELRACAPYTSNSRGVAMAKRVNGGKMKVFNKIKECSSTRQVTHCFHSEVARSRFWEIAA